MGAKNQIDILINAVNNTDAALKKIKQDVASVKDSFDLVKGGINQAGSAITDLTERFKYLTNGFLLLKGFEFFKGIASQAAEVERLGTVLHAVAANAGITTSSIDKADLAIQKLGITAASSRQSLSQFVQAGLKVEDAARLARAAQDLAVISGENSSQTFQGLTQAIEQQSIMMLRWRGIMVTNEEAQARYAATNGKSVAALADWEKKQALLEMTLMKSTRLTGIYEAAMGDVGKQAASLERYQTDAAVAIQNSLIPAYSEVVLQLTQFLRFVKLTADEQNATSTGAKSLAATVHEVGGALKDTVIWGIQHRDMIMGLVKAYIAFKAVQTIGKIGTKLKATGSGLIDSGKGNATKAVGEEVATGATNAHAAASEKSTRAMGAEAAAAGAATEALRAKAIAEIQAATASRNRNIAPTFMGAPSPFSNSTNPQRISEEARQKAANAAANAASARSSFIGAPSPFAAAPKSPVAPIAKSGAMVTQGMSGAINGVIGLLDKGKGSVAAFGGAVRNMGALVSGVFKSIMGTLGGLPGILLMAGAHWLIFGDGIKVLGGLVDTLGTKFGNALLHVKSFFQAFSGNKEGAEKSLMRASERSSDYEKREADRKKEEKPEYKEYKEAVNARYEKEASLLELEYQQAQIAEKLKGSHSSDDIAQGHAIQKRIMDAKLEAKAAGEVADAVARKNKISNKDQDLLKSEKDQEAYRKGKEYKATQQVNDVFNARQQIGETKQVYGMGAPISMEMGNAISALRKEFDAYSVSLEGADSNIYRLTYAYKNFMEAAKTPEELIIGQKEFQNMISESADRISDLQLLQEKGFGKKKAVGLSDDQVVRVESARKGLDVANLTDDVDNRKLTDQEKAAAIAANKENEARLAKEQEIVNPYDQQTEVKKYNAFEKLKKEATDEAENTGKSFGEVFAEFLAKSIKAKSTIEDYGNPAKVMLKQMQEVFNSDKSAENFFNSMVMGGKVSKEEAAGMSKDDKLAAAREEAAKLNTEFSKITVSRQQLDKTDMVFKSWQLSLAAVTKETDTYAKALDKVQGLLKTVSDRKHGDMQTSLFSAESPSTLGNKRNVEHILKDYQKSMAGIEMLRNRGAEGIQADRATTVGGAQEGLNKFYEDKAKAKAKEDDDRKRHLKKTDQEELDSVVGVKSAASKDTFVGPRSEIEQKAKDAENAKEDVASGYTKYIEEKKLRDDYAAASKGKRKVTGESAGDIQDTDAVDMAMGGTPDSARMVTESQTLKQLREKVDALNRTSKTDATLQTFEDQLGRDNKSDDGALFKKLKEAQAEKKAVTDKGTITPEENINFDIKINGITREREALALKNKELKLSAEEETAYGLLLAKGGIYKDKVDKKPEKDKADITAEATARQTAAEAVVAADKAAADKTRANDLQANESKIKVTKETYAAMQKELDSYISNYKAKVLALSEVHKGMIDYKTQVASMAIGDQLTNAQTKMYPDKGKIGNLEAQETELKLGSTTQKYDEDLAAYTKLIASKKSLIRSSGESEKEIAAQIIQTDADSVAKRLAMAKDYFSQLSSQRDAAKAKYKQYADEVISLEKEIRSTIIDSNASMRETAREGMTNPLAKYADKKKEMNEYISLAKEAEKAGDYAQAKEYAKKSQGIAKGLSGDAEGAGGNHLTAITDSMKGQEESRNVLVGIMQKEKSVAESNRNAQLATVNDVTDAMNSLGQKITELSTKSEITLSVKADESSMKELQSKLQSVSAEQDMNVKAVLDHESLSGMRDQINTAITTEPYFIKVIAELPEGVSKGSPTSNLGSDSGESTDKKADGGFIQGIGTGTSDSIPAMLSNGEFVIKQSSVGHYGTEFLNLLNSKALKFADGGLVSPNAPKFGLGDLIGSFGKKKEKTNAEREADYAARQAKESDATAVKVSGTTALNANSQIKDALKRREDQAGLADGGYVGNYAEAGMAAQTEAKRRKAKEEELKRLADVKTKRLEGLEAAKRVALAKRDGYAPNPKDVTLSSSYNNPEFSKEHKNKLSEKQQSKESAKPVDTAASNIIMRVDADGKKTLTNVPKEKTEAPTSNKNVIYGDIEGGGKGTSYADRVAGVTVSAEEEAFRSKSTGYSQKTKPETSGLSETEKYKFTDNVYKNKYAHKLAEGGDAAKDPKAKNKTSIEKFFDVLTGKKSDKYSSKDGTNLTTGSRGATGGLSTGTIPAWVSHGEFRVSPEAVNHYGANLMHAVNDMEFPKFSTGGSVGETLANISKDAKIGESLSVLFGKHGDTANNVMAKVDSRKDLANLTAMLKDADKAMLS